MSNRNKAYLRILTGPKKGGVYVLGELSVFELGRGEGCQIRLEDPLVAANHARIYRKAETWTFFDLNSERGSSINDIKVEKRELAGMEVIRVGKTELLFTFEPPAPSPVAPRPAGEHAAPKETASPAQPEPRLRPKPPPVPTPAQPEPQLRRESPSRPEPDLPPWVAPDPADRETAVSVPSETRPPDPVANATPPPVAAPKLPPARTAVPEAPAGDPEALNPTVAFPLDGSTRLVVIDGDPEDKGRFIYLDDRDSVTVGRGGTCEFMLADRKVSRAHCRLENRDGNVVLVDLGSSNGTIVNGDKVQKTLLRPGDYVRLGFTVLAYQWVPSPVNA